MVLQTDQFGNVINTGTTFGRQAEAAEQGMLGLSNFMAMGGGFDEFLVYIKKIIVKHYQI